MPPRRGVWLIVAVLQPNRRQPRCSPARFLVALAVACALVVVGFIAVSPQAHACLHAHHHAPDHDCMVKHLADGKLLLPVLDTALPAAVWGESVSPAVRPALFVPPVSDRLPAGRAPPTV